MINLALSLRLRSTVTQQATQLCRLSTWLLSAITERSSRADDGRAAPRRTEAGLRSETVNREAIHLPKRVPPRLAAHTYFVGGAAVNCEKRASHHLTAKVPENEALSSFNATNQHVQFWALDGQLSRLPPAVPVCQLWHFPDNHEVSYHRRDHR